MQSPEQFVLLVNATVLGCAYFLVYPRFAGADLGKLAMNDLIASGISLLVVGVGYWGSGELFDLLLFKVGWFGFTLLSFLLMEFPLFVWYARRYKVFERTGDGS